MPPPNMAGRRSSFAGSSDERADTKNRRASRSSRDRASRDGIEVIPESEDPAAQKRAADLKAKRRSDAMKNMGGGGLSEMMADMSANLVHGLDENATPNAKMQRVMIAAKERGLTVQQASARVRARAPARPRAPLPYPCAPGMRRGGARERAAEGGPARAARAPRSVV